jgi:hypothetical protein
MEIGGNQQKHGMLFYPELGLKLFMVQVFVRHGSRPEHRLWLRHPGDLRVQVPVDIRTK